MIISDQAPPGQDYLMRRLATLERQVRELAAARRMEAATIGSGGLTVTDGAIRVLDAGGVLKVQAGKLPDGTYGLAAVNDGGQLVTLSTLAFGLQAAVITTQEGRTSSTLGDLATVGPAVTVTVGETGRCLVMVGCTASYGAVFAGGLMGYAISGATTRAASIDEAMETSTTAENVVFGATRAFIAEGLTPGANTITAKYASASSGTSCLFQRRHIIALPF